MSANPLVSPERLEEIRKLWADWDNVPSRSEDEHRNTLCAPPTSRPGGPSTMFPDLEQPVIKGDFLECAPADKAFIAASPQIVDELLAEVARLRGDGERLDWWNQNPDKVQSCLFSTDPTAAVGTTPLAPFRIRWGWHIASRYPAPTFTDVRAAIDAARSKGDT